MSNTSTTNNNLATTSNHLLVFNRNETNIFQIQVQGFGLPGITLGVMHGQSYKITSYDIIGSTIAFNDLVCTVILDETMDSYFELYRWLMDLVNPEGPNPIPYDQLQTSAQLHILSNNKGDQKVELSFYDIFPVSILDIPFTTTDSGESNITFQVTFKYRKFTMVKDGIEY
jgi:hypothetical protein